MSRHIIACFLGCFLLLWCINEVRSFPFQFEFDTYVLDNFLFHIFSKFTYVADEEQYGEDRRISFAKEIKEGKTFKGDCDDFAYTVRDLLIERGYKAITVIVRTPPISGSILHMVVMVDDKYMIDNRYPFVRTWEQGIKGSQYLELNRK